MSTEVFHKQTILFADDEPALRQFFADLLADTGANVILVGSGKEAMQVINEHAIDLAILDVRMPEPGGLALLQHLRAKDVTVPVLIITGYSSASVAIESTHLGAYDFLTKPFDLDTVLSIISHALEHRRQTRQIKPDRAAQQLPDPRDIIIGQSAVMQEVYKLIGRVAASNTTVLITGESGTGKELVARTLHQTSPRREMPFVAFNCAALTETLLETELFGHEKGAFTGATARRKGRFEQAQGGTIFLDEIGEISATMQKKLLRVLQDKSFERVGGNVNISADARVLAATNRDLWQEVLSGRFREDLYYRLNVINLKMPPLRERRDDIAMLAEHFLTRFQRKYNTPSTRLTDPAVEVLLAHSWPGNVRQLENMIERAVVLAQDGLIMPKHLLLSSDTQDTSLLDLAIAELLHHGHTLEEVLHQIRRSALMIALQQHQGNREAAARMLHVHAADFEEV